MDVDGVVDGCVDGWADGSGHGAPFESTWIVGVVESVVDGISDEFVVDVVGVSAPAATALKELVDGVVEVGDEGVVDWLLAVGTVDVDVLPGSTDDVVGEVGDVVAEFVHPVTVTVEGAEGVVSSSLISLLEVLAFW